MKNRLCLAVVVVAFCCGWSVAKDSTLTMLWPQDKPAIRLTFNKFQLIAVLAGQSTFVCDVLVENLTNKVVPRASFNVYLMDESNIRIGDGFLLVSDVSPGQPVKVRFQFSSVGVPTGLVLSAKKGMLDPPEAKTISLRVLSVPPGAHLRVDGQDAGLTPVIVRLTVGDHSLNLTKEGYAPGNTPVEITPDEQSGGSITVELGGLSRDTVELRDGTNLLGDVLSMSMTSIVMRVDGKDQTYDRNQVKKIILVERLTTPSPSTDQHMSAQPKEH